MTCETWTTQDSSDVWKCKKHGEWPQPFEIRHDVVEWVCPGCRQERFDAVRQVLGGEHKERGDD